MSRKTTAILLAVALGLLGFILFVERDMLTSGEVAEREQRLLPRLVRDRVTKIVIERGDDRVEIVRTAAATEETEAVWSLAAPVRGPADARSIAALLGALEWAEPEQRFEGVTSADRERFGLEQPRLVARFTVGNEEQTLRFGGEDSTGAGYYAALDDAGVALVVGRDVYEAFDHDASHFRSKVLLGDALPDPTTLEVETAGGGFAARKEARGYALTRPFAIRALEPRKDAALDALRDLEATRFVGESPAQAAGNGLDAPFLRVVLDAPGVGTKELRVGAPCADHPSERHARLDEGPVVCVSEASLAPVLVDPLEIRDLRAVTARDFEVKGLVVERGGDRIEVTERDEALAYTVTRGGRASEGTTNEEAFHGWLRAMRDARATELIPLEGDAAARHGLERPRATVRIRYRGEDGAEDVLRIGDLTAEGLYARRGEEPFALVLPASADAVFEVAAHRLASRALLDEEADQLASVRIAGSGRDETLGVRDGSWAVTAPVEVAADGSRAADLARRLAALEADRFVADAAQPEHGLATPRWTVTARFEGAAGDDGHDHDHAPSDDPDAAPREHVLRVGAAATGGAYATLDGGPAVFVLPASVVALLERPLADPRALATSAAQIAAVRIEGGEGGEVAIRREGDAFTTSSGPADAERTRALVERLSSILATSVVGYGDPPADAGLAAPRARVVVSRTEDAPEPRETVLLVGAERGEGDARRTFVRREDLAVTFEVPGSLVDGILAYRP